MQGGWGPPPGGGYGPPGGGGGQPPGAPGGPPGYGAPPPGAPYGGPAPYGAPAQFGGPPGAGAYGAYEFNETENAVIDKTAGRAKLWGIISTVVGAMQLLASCGAFANPSLAGQLPGGIIALVVGIAFIGVGNSLKSVVQTQGNDLAHMMQALEKLGGAFLVQIIATVIGIVLLGIILVLALFVFAAAAAAG